MEIFGVTSADECVEISAVPDPTDPPDFTDEQLEENMTGINDRVDITAVTGGGEHVLEYGILRLGWGLSGFPGGLRGAGTTRMQTTWPLGPLRPFGLPAAWPSGPPWPAWPWGCWAHGPVVVCFQACPPRKVLQNWRGLWRQHCQGLYRGRYMVRFFRR